MASTNEKRTWILIVFILCGIVIGSLLGELAANVDWLRWLSFGKSFGISEPMTLNLGVIKMTFGLLININMASIIGMLIALMAYRYL